MFLEAPKYRNHFYCLSSVHHGSIDFSRIKAYHEDKYPLFDFVFDGLQRWG
jgi:hypothetical protein